MKTLLPPDQAPWLAVAARVMAGHYRDCDRSTRESLVIGLRSIQDPDCQEAVKRLAKVKPD